MRRGQRLGFHHLCLRLRRSPLSEPCAGIWRLGQTVNGEARYLCRRRRRRQGVVGIRTPPRAANHRLWPRAVLISSLRWHGGYGRIRGRSRAGLPWEGSGLSGRWHKGRDGRRVWSDWRVDCEQRWWATARQVLQKQLGLLQDGRQGQGRAGCGISW